MIKIDGSNIAKMPSNLSEYFDYKRSDTTTLLDNMQRNQLAKKHMADLDWENIKPTDLANILTWADSTTTHTYVNDAGKYAGVTFTFLATITSPGNYLPGGGYLVDKFGITIREV